MLVFAAAAYGTIAASVAYLVSGGDPLWMLVAMVVIAVLHRLNAYALIRRCGLERPPWWQWP